MSEKIRVLIVDDSALMRNLISKIVESAPNLEVADTAMNGQFALDKIPRCNPDVILLDVEMPVMNGLQFLQERKNQKIDIPVVMLSSLTSEGATVTMQCLEKGASDFIQKPSGSISLDIQKVAQQITEALTSYGGSYAKKKRGLTGSALHTYLNIDAAPETKGPQKTAEQYAAEKMPLTFETPLWASPAPKAPAEIKPVREPGKIEVIAIGISTGGPNALREVVPHLNIKIKQPILIVQHMPAGFTKEFAASLNNICPLAVKEAEDGDVLKRGQIYIAPGNHHIVVMKKGLDHIIRVLDTPQRNGHRPSVDVLFESVGMVFQNHALGIIMTGMGGDGAKELAEMRRQGARTLGQDEDSCIVYGMPKVAYEMGGVQEQVPLNMMAKRINEIALADN
ncbi:MAG: chemotaxis response regulator protein-glutamate methylesterase [Treponemataceae bacterium]|nr:chemotaxis response regulator protein-glutamate methylesterase [Treponemataceae bacterium]